MPLAGQIIVAGQIPGERIATTVQTADSATFTNTEVTLMTVTAPLVVGRTYRVSCYGHGASDVSTDDVNFRIREDDLIGFEMTIDRLSIDGSLTTGRKIVMEVEHTAVSTGDKTFVVTGVLSIGTGNARLEASGTRPAYLYVDYIRG